MTKEQKVLMAWIPKSEKGHKVARFLRAEGFDVPRYDVIGHYLANLYCASDLSSQQLGEIAFILNPDAAVEAGF